MTFSMIAPTIGFLSADGWRDRPIAHAPIPSALSDLDVATRVGGCNSPLQMGTSELFPAVGQLFIVSVLCLL